MRHNLYVIAALIFLLTMASAVQAATTVEVGIPGQVAAGGTINSIPEYIKYLYYFVLGLVGIAGFASLVFWGAVWAGSGVIDKKAQAISGIKNTFTGIGIALTAFILLNTINPDLIVIKTPDIRPADIPSAPKKDVLYIDYTAIWTALKNGQTCQSVYNSVNWVSTNQDKCPAEAKSRPDYIAEGYNACCMYVMSATPDEVESGNGFKWVQINPNQMNCEAILGSEWSKPTTCPTYIRPPEAENKTDYICCVKN